MADTASPIKLQQPKGTALINLAVAGLIVTALYFAREILVPVALAVLFSFVLAPFVILVYFLLLFPNAYLTYLVLFLALPAVLITLTAKTPPELVTALKLTSLTALFFAIVLGFALAF